MTNPSGNKMAVAATGPVSKPVSNARSRKLNTPDDAGKWNLSKDGKWRSSKVHAGLMQYIPSGVYFARAKVDGTVKRASLDTEVFTDAKDRLPGKIKELRTPKPDTGAFSEYLEKFKTKTVNDSSLSAEGIKYRLRCANKLEESWPAVLKMKVADITADGVEDWWNDFSTEYSAQFVNHTLTYFRFILRKLAKVDVDPLFSDISKVGVKPKELTLPSNEQFQSIVAHVRTIGTRNGGIKSPVDFNDSGDMVEFLAYSGCRRSEACKILWRDVDFEKATIRVPCKKRRRSSHESVIRILPMIQDMKVLLQRMKARKDPQPDDRVIPINSCRRALTNACKAVKAPELTHHNMRDFFITLCIESGVDMPTISRWVGHSDGGALLMRVYGHLRQDHSQAMAAKVGVRKEQPANVVPYPKASGQI